MHPTKIWHSVNITNEKPTLKSTLQNALPITDGLNLLTFQNEFLIRIVENRNSLNIDRMAGFHGTAIF